MLVRDVMTPSPICGAPDDTLDSVAALMLKHNCGAIPICDGQKLVGIITDRDITCRAVALRRDPALIRASDVMTHTVYTLGPDEDVAAAIDLMETKLIRRVPVVDAGGNVIGIVAPSDLAPTFASSNVADFLLAVSYWNHRAAAPATTAQP